MKKYTYAVVHGLAECADCDWSTQSYKNAQALAARHAKQHGHSSFSYEWEEAGR